MTLHDELKESCNRFIQSEDGEKRILAIMLSKLLDRYALMEEALLTFSDSTLDEMWKEDDELEKHMDHLWMDYQRHPEPDNG